MKIVVAEGLQKSVILVNEAVFREFVKAGVLGAINVEEADKEDTVSIVEGITGCNVVAVFPNLSAKKPKKGRSQMEKVGKYRYLNRKLDGLRGDMKDLQHKIDVIMLSFSSFLNVTEDSLKNIVCKDEVDEALLDLLQAKGSIGVTPSEAIVSDELREYELKPYHITRRIQYMNRRMKETLDKTFAVSVHRRWRLSRFTTKSLEGVSVGVCESDLMGDTEDEEEG